MAASPYNSIKAFKTGFNGGTRSNRFEVVSTSGWPARVGTVDIEKSKLKIHATTMPKSDLGQIGIGYRGRIFSMAGDRSYSVWPIQMYDDSGNNNLWVAFNKWKELIDGHVTHTVDGDNFSYSKLQKTWVLNQLGLNGDVIRTFKLVNCWPSQIGGILLDMNSVDVVTFPVTLTFDYFEITKGLK
jgi:hypothetical protein